MFEICVLYVLIEKERVLGRLFVIGNLFSCVVYPEVYKNIRQSLITFEISRALSKQILRLSATTIGICLSRFVKLLVTLCTILPLDGQTRLCNDLIFLDHLTFCYFLSVIFFVKMLYL